MNIELALWKDIRAGENTSKNLRMYVLLHQLLAASLAEELDVCDCSSIACCEIIGYGAVKIDVMKSVTLSFKQRNSPDYDQEH